MSLILFLGDSSKIGQVINNFISNAIKFAKEGEIKVSFESQYMDENQSMVTIAVEDNGIGIPEEAYDKIFESFVQADQSTTRKYGGTGLGLSISQRLAELMNGRVYFKSELGLAQPSFLSCL